MPGAKYSVETDVWQGPLKNSKPPGALQSSPYILVLDIEQVPIVSGVLI
jgi:hypothetical protein